MDELPDSYDWASTLEKLYAHSIIRLRWLGLTSQKRMQGKESKDFVHEAITRFFEGQRKWDPTKEPDLLNYLKGVINSLVWSLYKSKERIELSDLEITDIISDSKLFDKMVEAKIINDDFIDKIEDTLLNDEMMWLVFKSRCEGMKPQDIEDKYGDSIEDIRNAQKRLRRHIKNITNLK
jgi:hypothetical protein